jgi:hypothetical protein
VAARNEASARIAEAIEKEMTKRDLSRADVLNRIEARTGKRPGRQWASRTFSGGSHFTVQVPSEVPNDLLKEVVSAIEPDPERAEKLSAKLGRIAVRKTAE